MSCNFFYEPAESVATFPSETSVQTRRRIVHGQKHFARKNLAGLTVSMRQDAGFKQVAIRTETMTA